MGNDNKKSKTGIIVMVCNIIIMICNYVINLFPTKVDDVAYIIDKVTGIFC